MNTLAFKWQDPPAGRKATFPTSVRLRPEVDSLLQDVLGEFTNTTQTQIINDVIYLGK